jgi:hypothetical protein
MVCRRGVEPGLYTVTGRQAGGLRRKCNSVLIRKAKTRRAVVWEVVTFWPPTGRVQRREGGASWVTS